MSKKGLRVAKRLIKKQYRPIKKAARKAKRMERLKTMAENRADNGSMSGSAPIQNTVNYNAIGDALNI